MVKVPREGVFTGAAGSAADKLLCTEISCEKIYWTTVMQMIAIEALLSLMMMASPLYHSNLIRFSGDTATVGIISLCSEECFITIK